MATPAKANFKIKANGYWTKVWQIKNAGAPMDITGFDFEIEIKKAKGSRVPKFMDLTVGDGITIVDALEGKIKIDIPPQDAIAATTTYYYDLIAIKDGKPYVWLEGEMIFDPGVSYMDS